MYEGPWKRRGIFQPKIMDTLRPQMQTLIGHEFDLDYAGTSDDDEPYPGQTRWMIARNHDADLGSDQIGRWIPEEDIQFIDCTLRKP